jgi:hypothetical protein
MHWANGDSYEGFYEDGLMHGQGIYKHADGSRYQGQFTENIRQGYGVCTFADASLYEGQWLKDKPEGEGRIIYPNGEVVSSKFADGVQELVEDPNSKARIPMVAVQNFEKPSQPGLPDSLKGPQHGLPGLPPLPALSRSPLPQLALEDSDTREIRLPVAAAPAPRTGEQLLALPAVEPVVAPETGVTMQPLPPPTPPLPKGRPASRGLAQAPRRKDMD